MSILNKERLTIKILFLLPIILCTLILFLSILEPYLEYNMCPFAEKVFRGLHYICHQAPSKSIWIGNYTIAICSRCFAVYIALIITGIAIYYKNYLKVKWYMAVLLTIPMIIDVLTQWFELRVSSNALRIFTGFLGGIGVGLLFYPLYMKLILYLKMKFMKGGE